MRKLLILLPLLFSSGCAFSFGVRLCEPPPVVPVIQQQKKRPVERQQIENHRPLDPASIVLNG
jgi:hypothetical protein